MATTSDFRGGARRKIFVGGIAIPVMVALSVVYAGQEIAEPPDYAPVNRTAFFLLVFGTALAACTSDPFETLQLPNLPSVLLVQATGDELWVTAHELEQGPLVQSLAPSPTTYVALAYEANLADLGISPGPLEPRLRGRRLPDSDLTYTLTPEGWAVSGRPERIDAFQYWTEEDCGECGCDRRCDGEPCAVDLDIYGLVDEAGRIRQILSPDESLTLHADIVQDQCKAECGLPIRTQYRWSDDRGMMVEGPSRDQCLEFSLLSLNTSLMTWDPTAYPRRADIGFEATTDSWMTFRSLGVVITDAAPQLDADFLQSEVLMPNSRTTWRAGSGLDHTVSESGQLFTLPIPADPAEDFALAGVFEMPVEGFGQCGIGVQNEQGDILFVGTESPLVPGLDLTAAVLEVRNGQARAVIVDIEGPFADLRQQQVPVMLTRINGVWAAYVRGKQVWSTPMEFGAVTPLLVTANLDQLAVVTCTFRRLRYFVL